MRQGASRHRLRDRKDDLYETPSICVRAALAAGIFPRPESGVVWEPCSGRGAISRELKAAGYSVVSQDLVSYDGADDDIVSGIDFLMETKAPNGVSAIITNPPFKLADEFIRHGLSLVPRVIVFQRAMAIEGCNRADIIDNHLRGYWIGIDRPPAMHREGWTGKKISTSGAPFAWFDFESSPRPRAQPIELHRLLWRGKGQAA